MLKKILYLLMFIVITAGAVYSYQKVDFGRNTVMFFNVAFGSGSEMGGRSGRPSMGENSGGEMSRPAPPSGQPSGRDFQDTPSGRPSIREGGERGTRPNLEQGEPRGSRPARGSERRSAPGGVISLGKVGAYAVLMAFVVMVIRLLDRLIFKMNRSKQYI